MAEACVDRTSAELALFRANENETRAIFLIRRNEEFGDDDGVQGGDGGQGGDGDDSKTDKRSCHETNLQIAEDSWVIKSFLAGYHYSTYSHTTYH